MKWVVIALVVIVVLAIALLVWGFGMGGFDLPPELIGDEWIG
ncbi:MAG TPA: hypothetical protein VFE45_13980 [Coriobacteriia bacterium]|nr:hypothetical protein [Coriobacteriia bacterium]